jgi:hypothetical protein
MPQSAALNREVDPAPNTHWPFSPTVERIIASRADGDATAAPRARLVLVWLAAWTLVAMAGCGDHPVSIEDTQGNVTQTQVGGDPVNPADVSATQRCDTLLASSLDMIQPDNLEISADVKLAVDTLNNWVRDCGSLAPADDGAAKDPAFLKFLPESERGTATEALYDQRDIEHVRNCRMFKLAIQPIMKSTKSDVDRIVDVFELTNRLVALNGAGDPDVPATLFDVALVGRGTAKDRAWVFGELLRQAGYDAVILTPRSPGGANQETRRWLVGVPLRSKIYLFDTVLSWPIPSKEDKGDTPTIRRPATLDEVLADDGLLRKLDVSADKPYPLRSAELKSPHVQVITECRYWLPRIKRLEMFLSGERSASAYVPLGNVGTHPGLLSRVIAAGTGLWKPEDVSVWDYPDRRSEAANKLNPQKAELRELNHLPFEGPMKDEIDIKVMKVISKGTDHKQIKARVAQLQGDCAKAIRNYLLVQLEELQPAIPLPPEGMEVLKAQGKEPEGPVTLPVPKRDFVVNFRAAEDAKFWMAVCQFEQQAAPETAAENFGAYLRGYAPRNGIWVIPAAVLRSVALARGQQYALAVQSINQLLRAMAENDPRRPTCELFAVRWRHARDAARTHEEPAAQKPAETKAAPPAAAKSTAPAATPKPDSAPAKPPEKPPAAKSADAKTKSP